MPQTAAEIFADCSTITNTTRRLIADYMAQHPDLEKKMPFALRGLDELAADIDQRSARLAGAHTREINAQRKDKIRRALTENVRQAAAAFSAAQMLTSGTDWAKGYRPCA